MYLGHPLPPHQTSNSILAINPPTSTQNDGLIYNLKSYIDKVYENVYIFLAKKHNTDCKQMALQHQHPPKMVQPILECPLDYICTNHANPKLHYIKLLGIHQRKHILKQDIPPTSNLCPSQQNDACLHLLSCCKNKHINILRTNQHNKAVHTLANALLAHPITRCFTIFNVGKLNNRTP